ncbi:pre-mRNA-splicing factor ISY1 homolog [Poecilia latipinna]|uniref:pre-mRNA-splicing factor ISY1 homolog n=1 Tax=Poecilia latipinna TaxID=48699 RepID=UPI00072DD80B|nr:PREDICTED: pre-mRNA-splicing factor ISY1 homolog [Poecilia latipinna]
MARNAEKAMTALARFRQAQLEEGKVKERRPFLASECSELPKAEKWRRQIISEISKKVAQIQNVGCFLIADWISESDLLLVLWQRIGPRMLDHEGKEVPGNRGYKYFGAARDLPGVRELFETDPTPAQRKTRGELMKDVDAEYYGYRDEDDGVLLPLEAEYERKAVSEAVQKWRTEKESRVQQEEEEDEEEESIYTVHNEEVEDEENREETEGEEGVGFIAHVPVPSQKEVEEALVRRKKMELLQRYASETLQAQSQEARTLLGL